MDTDIFKELQTDKETRSKNSKIYFVLYKNDKVKITKYFGKNRDYSYSTTTGNTMKEIKLGIKKINERKKEFGGLCHGMNSQI